MSRLASPAACPRYLRAVLTHLTGDEGKAELKDIGGLSAATVGVILRSLITFADQAEIGVEVPVHRVSPH